MAKQKKNKPTQPAAPATSAPVGSVPVSVESATVASDNVASHNVASGAPAAEAVGFGTSHALAPKKSWVARNYIPLLSILLLFTFLGRLYRLEEPPSYSYDEVYFAYTANLLVEGDKKIFDPWSKPEPGFAHEWTHPPLGKTLMAMGIAIFGDNPFGWRISSVFFGTAVVFLSALCAQRIFRVPEISLMTAYLLSVEGLLFTQSRIGMIDVHLVFFVLCALLFLLAWKQEPDNMVLLFGLGLAMGLATATKWSSVSFNLFIGLSVCYSWLFKNELPLKNWVLWFLLFLVALPIGLYFLSYSQFFAMGYSLEQLVELQKQMWYYHSQLKATHSSSSEIWQWLLNIKPVWYSRTGNLGPAGDRTAVLYCLGNHVVLYTGQFAVIWCLWRAWRAHKAELLNLALLYLLVLLPWIWAPRVKFFYHYLPAVPFLCLMQAYMLYYHNRNVETGEEVRKTFVLQTTLWGALGWFLIIYPVIAAVPIRKAFLDFLYLLMPAVAK